MTGGGVSGAAARAEALAERYDRSAEHLGEAAEAWRAVARERQAAKRARLAGEYEQAVAYHRAGDDQADDAETSARRAGDALAATAYTLAGETGAGGDARTFARARGLAVLAEALADAVGDHAERIRDEVAQ